MVDTLASLQPSFASQKISQVSSLVTSSSSHCHMPPHPHPKQWTETMLETCFGSQISRMTSLLSVGIRVWGIGALHRQGNEETALQVCRPKAFGAHISLGFTPLSGHLPCFLILCLGWLCLLAGHHSGKEDLFNFPFKHPFCWGNLHEESQTFFLFLMRLWHGREELSI